MSSSPFTELTEGLSRAFEFIVDPFHLKQKAEKDATAPFDQPYLEPTRWFLTEGEMLTSRAGHQRDGIQLYSTGNRVKLYVASAGYFNDVANDMMEVRRGDLVYIAGWGTCNVPFKPLEPDTKLCDLAEGAVKRGADWRMLVWSNLTERAQNHEGEQSIFHARIKAIRNAQNYIFIQDQYFILVPELLEAIMDMMPSIERLIVIMQRTVEAEYTGYAKYLYDMVSPIQEAYPDKFKLYSTKESKELYIHSKLVIVDDVYVSLGSANWNRRSMTSDTEIGINIVDTELVQSPDNITVNKLARNFRIQKFMEATKRTYDELDAMTFLEACDALETAAHDDGKSIIEPYAVEFKPQFNLVSDGLRQLVDPDVLGDENPAKKFKNFVDKLGPQKCEP
ncbi:hypothetical protein PRIC2_014929 [Phytophthora ramorum]